MKFENELFREVLNYLELFKKVFILKPFKSTPMNLTQYRAFYDRENKTLSLKLTFKDNTYLNAFIDGLLEHYNKVIENPRQQFESMIALYEKPNNKKKKFFKDDIDEALVEFPNYTKEEIEEMIFEESIEYVKENAEKEKEYLLSVLEEEE